MMYDAESKAAVLYLKSEGYSDRAIGQMDTFKTPEGKEIMLPSRDAISDWRNEDHTSYDKGFCRQYARACEDNLWSEHEKLRGITKSLLDGQIDPAAARAASDNIKWDLARRMRHVFGDKLDVTSKDKELKGAVIIVASDKDKEALEKV